MSDYRHGWIVAGDVTDPKTGEPRQDGLIHYDLKTGKSTGWSAGTDDRFGEPIFVPRTDDAAEGDGWLLSVLYRGEERRSATSRCSRRPTSPRARSPSPISAAASRRASTATGGRDALSNFLPADGGWPEGQATHFAFPLCPPLAGRSRERSR